MAINIGDIDVAKEIVELHYQLRRTQKLLEIVTSKIPIVGGAVLQAGDLESAHTDALNYIKDKFPNMGIEWKS